LLTKRMETYSCGHECPVEATLDAIGGKWKGLIIFHLLTHKVIRFNQMQRLIPSATRKTLTRQLRELEDVGIVARRVYSEVPPKVEYSLTEIGRSLEPIIRMMRDWGARWIEPETAGQVVSLASSGAPTVPHELGDQSQIPLRRQGVC